MDIGCLGDVPSPKSYLHISILSVVQGMCQLGWTGSNLESTRRCGQTRPILQTAMSLLKVWGGLPPSQIVLFTWPHSPNKDLEIGNHRVLKKGCGKCCWVSQTSNVDHHPPISPVFHHSPKIQTPLWDPLLPNWFGICMISVCVYIYICGRQIDR